MSQHTYYGDRRDILIFWLKLALSYLLLILIYSQFSETHPSTFRLVIPSLGLSLPFFLVLFIGLDPWRHTLVSKFTPETLGRYLARALFTWFIIMASWIIIFLMFDLLFMSQQEILEVIP